MLDLTTDRPTALTVTKDYCAAMERLMGADLTAEDLLRQLRTLPKGLPHFIGDKEHGLRSLYANDVATAVGATNFGTLCRTLGEEVAVPWAFKKPLPPTAGPERTLRQVGECANPDGHNEGLYQVPSALPASFDVEGMKELPYCIRDGVDNPDPEKPLGGQSEKRLIMNVVRFIARRAGVVHVAAPLACNRVRQLFAKLLTLIAEKYKTVPKKAPGRNVLRNLKPGEKVPEATNQAPLPYFSRKFTVKYQNFRAGGEQARSLHTHAWHPTVTPLWPHLHGRGHQLPPPCASLTCVTCVVVAGPSAGHLLLLLGLQLP